jgi:hypothetical protein
VTVNGVAWRQGTLRNGDLIELGAVRLQFWLSETQQQALWPRRLTWAAIAVFLSRKLL